MSRHNKECFVRRTMPHYFIRKQLNNMTLTLRSTVPCRTPCSSSCWGPCRTLCTWNRACAISGKEKPGKVRKSHISTKTLVNDHSGRSFRSGQNVRRLSETGPRNERKTYFVQTLEFFSGIDGLLAPGALFAHVGSVSLGTAPLH